MVAAPTETRTSITESLGIRGWAHLDAVLLAALATKAPLLLIGPHGTGKSQLIEQVAHALNLGFRHYNAALLNYDDIIGIPMPTDDGEELRFIKSPGTIWDAGFVFLDEISRCRADLQNKLFPIIHERRVVGIQLDELQHRWSAMNPPAPEEIDAAASQYYIGSEPLDPALTDRFPFIVPVPTWAEIEREDRRELVKWQENGAVATQPIDLISLVQETEELIPQIEADMDEWLSDYIVCLVDLLESNSLPQSPRRARMLARSVA
ncbi:MAG: MoxR family ATPase, partial [Chloroflexota bacterium]